MNLPIYITEDDARRLRPLVRATTLQRGPDAENLKRLESELERAHVVPESDLPANVIAMNSTVELEDLTDGERFTYTLVYPEHADVDQGRISILAPLGTAMLGYRVGDTFEWPVPGGTICVRVLRLRERLKSPAPPAIALVNAPSP